MSKIVVIIGFLVSFVAGVTVARRGLLPVATNPAHVEADPKPPTTAASQQTRPSDRDRGGWLNAELKLTTDQQAQMKEIWSATAHEGRREREERRAALRKDRDDLIAKLMVESGKKDEFDWIYVTYEQKVAALDAEWRGKFQSAVERTKAILDETQRAKYEEILSRHNQPPQGGGGERGGSGSGINSNDRNTGRKTESSATSRPDRQTPPDVAQ